MLEKILIVVPRFHPALKLYMDQKFRGQGTVTVIVERRERQRRQQQARVIRERRRMERRKPARPCALVVPVA
ncbi:MAG TPA: hypothetical protein VFN71_00380 [Methylomirabilota bacterium]|nr:hypothetical protein [Methylomirabilota bacterium]